jgi:hypothetical protein
MKSARVLIIVALLILTFITISPDTGEALGTYDSENVIICVIDGLRFTEGFGDSTHQNVPYMWNYMRPNGTVDMRFENNGVTKTNSGHASIVTGTYQTVANDGSVRPYRKTIFEVYREQKSIPQNKAWVVSGKAKLDILTYSTDDNYGSDYGASFVTSETVEYDYNDTDTWADVQYVMDTHHPSLMLINLGEVDSDGHSGNWGEYVRAIRGADWITYQLWQKIQSDSHYKDKTTLIVTNDHGRHTNGTSTGWKDHGHDDTSQNCMGCSHIMFLAMGPDVKKDEQLMSGMGIPDIAPTVAALLDFDMPDTTGSVMVPILTHAPPTNPTNGGETGEEETDAGGILDSPIVPVAVIVLLVVNIAAVVMMKKKPKQPEPRRQPQSQSQSQPSQPQQQMTSQDEVMEAEVVEVSMDNGPPR